MDEEEGYTNKELMDALMESRRRNTAQHMEILKSTEIASDLSSQISEVIDNFAGFTKTIKWVKNLMITFGFLYLIFKDSIHSIFL